MSTKIECPYCGCEHTDDDGEYTSTDKLYEMQCENEACQKLFIFYAEISIDYNTYEAPCLNGESDHIFIETATYPRRFTKLRCRICEEVRDLSKERYEELLELDKKDGACTKTIVEGK